MIKGKIIDINADGNAIIQAPIDTYIFTHRKVKEAYIDYIDSRPLSDKQRRMCYALINAIAEWSGETAEGTKTALKLDFWQSHVETLADKIFSLSNAPMSLVAEFQRYLVRFIIDNDIPLKFPLLDYVDDIKDYTYACLIHKKCVVCGKRADLHHIDAIGMGNDRNDVQHIGREVISLCREHHTEIHTLGKSEFMEKYHLEGGIEADKTILKIYGLKR
jgi:hypothetical protein